MSDKPYVNNFHREVYQICKKNVDAYLDDLYKRVPDIRAALNGFYMEKTFPTLPGHDDYNRFELYNMQKMTHQIDDAKHEFFAPIHDEELLDTIDEETLELYNGMREIFQTPEELRTVFPDYKFLKELAVELKAELEEMSRWETFLEIRKDDEIRTQVWLSTIINMNNFTINFIQDPISIEDGRINVSWQVLTYSYLRDFELFFKYFIDPSLGNMDPRSRYVDRIKKFCDTPDAMTVFNDLLNDYMKPAVRSRIAHQLYYIDLQEQEIVFIKDPNYPDSIDKTYSLDKLNELAWNMNKLLWIAFAIVFELKGEYPESPYPKFFPSKSELESFQEFELYNDLKELPVFEDHLDDIYDHFLSLNSRFDDELTPFPYPILESVLILRIFGKGEYDPDDLFSFINMGSKMMYLVGYTLLEERFLKPMVKALDDTVDLAEIRDCELLEKVKEHKDGKYQPLFQSYDPDVRNAIAHMEYYLSKDNIPKFRNRRTGETQNLKTDGLGMTNLFGRLESIFDTKRDKIPLFMGIAQVIDQLYYKKDWDSGLIESGYDFILDEGIEYAYSLIIVASLINSVMDQNSEELEYDIAMLAQQLNLDDRDIEFIWTGIFVALHRHPVEVFQEVMKKLILQQQVEPKNTSLMNKIIAAYYFRMGDDTKAVEYLI